MKRKIQIAILCLLLAGMDGMARARSRNKPTAYVILAPVSVARDTAWKEVIAALQEKHGAGVLYYDRHPVERQKELRELKPRHVAIVEKPEALDRQFIMDAHVLSRSMDEDIYADYLWGVITGHDAPAALRMVRNSTTPLVVKDAVATITELHSAKWFDRYAWVDDHQVGLWGEKTGKNAPVVTGNIPKEEVLRKFTDLYSALDPDLVVTAAHATTRNLEMPFSLGNIKAREGTLYAEDRFTRQTWDLENSGKRKVYFAVGNCLIGNVNNTRESMAIAWMNSGNAAVMIGYVVLTWHGRNGWGGLKYWLTTPGRYTLAEAIFLNQQDFLFQQHAWNPVFTATSYPHAGNFAGDMQKAVQSLTEALGTPPTREQLGFWHDRDVLAYYGDPKWDVRLQEIPSENDFKVTMKARKKKRVITIETGKHFNLERLQGDHFKEEHVLDIPFSYFFPERLVNPRLAPGQNWNVALDENFMLVYDPAFEAGKRYTITIETDE